nr:hypothetical protein [Nitrosomonas nitrosa]
MHPWPAPSVQTKNPALAGGWTQGPQGGAPKGPPSRKAPQASGPHGPSPPSGRRLARASPDGPIGKARRRRCKLDRWGAAPTQRRRKRNGGLLSGRLNQILREGSKPDGRDRYSGLGLREPGPAQPGAANRLRCGQL